jgi:2-keto-4-pentenoate hydratase
VAQRHNRYSVQYHVVRHPICNSLKSRRKIRMSFHAETAAAHIARAHKSHERFANLDGHLAPPTIADAYRVQEALVPLWTESRGPVAGLKIATTTKIMQQLMGIDHPCGGMIYANTIHMSPAMLDRSRFMHVVVECELAVRLGRDLPAIGRPLTRDDVLAAVAEVMPAFELIEDRHADYKTTNALSLIADNAWNGGIVLGPGRAPPAGHVLDGLAGALSINGKPAHAGKTDDPLGALAWVANLAIERGRPMTKGMAIITGSVIPTLAIHAGDHLRFELAGLGAVELRAL